MMHYTILDKLFYIDTINNISNQNITIHDDTSFFIIIKKLIKTIINEAKGAENVHFKTSLQSL